MLRVVTIPGSFAVSLSLLSCTTGPLNGTPYSGASTVGATFNFQGFTNQQSESISLQSLISPTADPTQDASWLPFASTATSTNPITVGDPSNPLYSWSITAAPAPAGFTGWPVGGVLRTRAVSQDNARTLTTFDAPTFSACLGAGLEAGDTWATIGTSCNGLGGGMVALVSTAATPLTLPASQQPDWLGYKGDITTSQTETYYNSWGAPTTLGAFKTAYGFTAGDPTATYYNDNDLAIGREMHCHKITTGSGGIACYVSNYSATAGVGSFGDNPTTVLANAIAHSGAFATVAMVYTPPANSPNSVKFVVYDKNQNRTDTAKLDTVGAHVSVPNNCLTCHGIDSLFLGGQVNGNAKFLPFDPASYVFSTQSGFTLNDQQEAFRQLNALVAQTSLTAAENDFLAGIYAPNSVNTPGAFANDTYVPSNWVSSSGQALQSTYLGIIKVGCRTCHMSATNTALDFLEETDWTPTIVNTIRRYICQPASASGSARHPMPQAQRTTQKFWQSGARGLLITGWPYQASGDDGFEACVP